MRIIACYKSVPNDQEISVNSDKTLDTIHAQLAISRYDLEAVEAAVQLSDENDEVFVLTVSGVAADNSKLRKSILSRGPAQLYAVHDGTAEIADSLKTALSLKAAVEKIDNVDLVLCGEGSEDMYCQEVGPILGSLLGWSTLNAVSSITRSATGLRVERNIENSTEVLEVPLPAVISVTAGINTPKIPSMREILAAGKKPFTLWEAQEIGAATENTIETLSILAPEMTSRRGEVFNSESDDGIESFYQLLRKSL
ncbi:MAG: putative electron transfer flavoprotein FixA [Oscillospiraceae bacterium]